MNYKGVIHVRIDDRLIHGQVIGFWTNTLNVNRIMVANDEVSVDEIRKSALRLVVPPNIRSSLIDIDRASENINAGGYEGQRVFLIVNSPVDAVRLIEKGVEIDEINTGNLSTREGTRNVIKHVNITDEELDAYFELDKLGVKLIAQLVPDNKKEDLMAHLKQLK